MNPATLSRGHKKSTVKRPAAPRAIARLGETQRAVLDVLSKRKTASAVDVRDLIGKPATDHGTRATHAVLKRLVEAGLVQRNGKLGDGLNKTGSVVTFSITSTGREARKAKS